jgi:hypothetical protein
VWLGRISSEASSFVAFGVCKTVARTPIRVEH